MITRAPEAGKPRLQLLADRGWIAQIALIGGAAILFLVVFPATLSDFRLNLMGKLLSFAIIAIGIDLLWGYGGMLSLGQGVFFGLGGYAMAMYLKMVASDGAMPDFMVWSGLHKLPFFWKPFEHAWVAIPAALIVPGVLAFILGYMVFRSRVKGVYFSIITQALALALSTFLISQQGYTGGTNGLTNYTTLFGKALVATETQHLLYSVTVVCLLATYLVAWLITRSRFGRLLVALRDDEDRVRFTGYNVALIKACVFAISGIMAGLSGALYVPQVGIISPANLAIVPSIEMVIWVAVGGRNTLVGAVVGAITVGLARSYLSESFPDIWLYFLGALFVGSVVIFPNGIVGTLKQGVEFLTRRMGGRSGGDEPSRTPAVVTGAGVMTPDA